MLQAYGFDVGQEAERKKAELEKGITELLNPNGKKAGNEVGTEDQINTEDKLIGRPEMEDYERNSDPAKAVTGRQPKPSNPEGSEKQT